MINKSLILLGKSLSKTSHALNLGHGSTWPGHIALKANKNFVQDILRGYKGKIIFVAGTNGKTTTAKLVQTILEKSGKSVFRNTSGANLLNGLASSLLLNTSFSGTLTQDYIIFEIDENALPHALKAITPSVLILLNLFRDQLDRYGEVGVVAKKWDTAIKALPPTTTLILNADDPQIAFLGHTRKDTAVYFGLEDATLATTSPEHAADTTYCPNCSEKLTYSIVYFSHLGVWACPNCHFSRPKPTHLDVSYYPLKGTYNKYNTLAAVLLSKTIGLEDGLVTQAMQSFTPAFGRQETIQVAGKRVQLFLAKNPTSFNQSLRTIQEENGKHILIVLNDRIPDGQDVSWIWDIDFEAHTKPTHYFSTAGDRVLDMSLRLKYAYPKITHVDTYTLLTTAIQKTLQNTPENETLYVLPTYSAMLEVRKILTGKKIL